MTAKLAEADQMTVEEFLAFYDARPDGEKWELIEGAAVMSPSPTEWHQVIVGNLIMALGAHKLAKNASWIPMIGVGTRVPVSPNSLPQPDAFVKGGAAQDVSITDDALVLFEVLSRSNNNSDQAWRKRVYSSVPNCQHHVTIGHKTAEVVRYDRETGWQGVTIKGLGSDLALPAIEAVLPLADLYRWTPIQ